MISAGKGRNVDIDFKKLLLEHGLMKNIGLAIRTLGDDSLKIAEVKVGGEPAADSKASAKIDLDCTLTVSGVEVHLDLPGLE